jgi:glycerol-3-phosphate dehydrogenase
MPIFGGRIKQLCLFILAELIKRTKCVSEEVLRHLIATYGSEYREVLQYCEAEPRWRSLLDESTPAIGAEVIYGIHTEMAQKLGDILLRRTQLGAAGYPGNGCIETCAAIMAQAKGWNKSQTIKEIDETVAMFSRRSTHVRESIPPATHPNDRTYALLCR